MTFSTINDSAAGQVAGQMAGPCESDSGYLENSSYTGIMISQGTVENALKAPASYEDVVNGARGITRYQPLKTPYDETNGIQDASGDEIDIVSRGHIWARTEEAVAVSDKPYCRYTANGTGKTILGNFRNDADFTSVDILLEDASPAESETWTLTFTANTVELGSVVYTNDASPTIKEAVDGLVALVNTGLYGQHMTAANVSDTTVRITPRIPGESIAVVAAASGGSATATVDTVTNTSPAESTCAPVQGTFRSAVLAAGIAKLEINLPH
jgi:hypothetical protein